MDSQGRWPEVGLWEAIPTDIPLAIKRARPAVLGISVPTVRRNLELQAD